MNTPHVKRMTSTGYYALTPDTVPMYLAAFPDMTARLGGGPNQWTAREVGDGNLNLVFIVEGPQASIVVKQALPYVRLVGESWPLPLSRAHFEHRALVEHTRWAAEYVPEIYAHDAPMALTVMQCLSPHIILRKGLVRGVSYPHMAEHLGKFLARTLYHTSDFHLPSAVKKEKIGSFLANTALCKISEDLIFDEPYFDAPMNCHTAPQLDDLATAFKQDTALKRAVQEMKWRFQNHAEALLHGDLHTGSVMVTPHDTRVIDPEFAFYGPMGFDTGALLANLWMAYFAQEGLENTQGKRASYAQWILDQTTMLWETFCVEFLFLAQAREENNAGGDILNPRLYTQTPALAQHAMAGRLEKIWEDTLGFAGCKIIRRILGLAHVEDFETISDADRRAACERRALDFARALLIHRGTFKTISDVTKAVQ